MTTVVVADESRLLTAIVEASLDGTQALVVARTHSVPQLVDLCRTWTPDVAVIGLRLSDGAVDGDIPSILSLGTRVLILGDEVDQQGVDAALLAGASGYLSLRDTGPNDVASSVQAIASGRAVLHPAAAATILEQWRHMRQRGADQPWRTRSLTQRETEVLGLIAEGLTTRAISRRLSVAPKTVENHKARIYSKLGTNNQTHAVAMAIRTGALPPPVESQ